MVEPNLRDSVVMVIGGTGSFGTALTDWLDGKVKKVLIFSRDENKQHQMWLSRKEKNIEYIIGDVRSKDRLVYAMKGVDYVFSAAALKHVPTGELFPSETIQTNTLGTENVIEAAEYCRVKKVIILSSDKAAKAENCYGATKYLAEKIAMAHKGDTINVCLRYGNVLGSRGSVLPIWISQIEQGIPLTITDGAMTRFVISLSEAVQLAIKCIEGSAGELFVMKPPATTIENLATALELYYGRELSRKIIGIRPGEKMHEILITSSERLRASEQVENGITYVRIPANISRNYFDVGDVHAELKDFTSLDAEQLNPEQVLAKLKEAELL